MIRERMATARMICALGADPAHADPLPRVEGLTLGFIKLTDMAPPCRQRPMADARTLIRHARSAPRSAPLPHGAGRSAWAWSVPSPSTATSCAEDAPGLPADLAAETPDTARAPTPPADRAVKMTNGRMMPVDLPRLRNRKALPEHPHCYADRAEVLQFPADCEHGRHKTKDAA